MGPGINKNKLQIWIAILFSNSGFENNFYYVQRKNDDN